jgi:hypothetical protein
MRGTCGVVEVPKTIRFAALVNGRGMGAVRSPALCAAKGTGSGRHFPPTREHTRDSILTRSGARKRNGERDRLAATLGFPHQDRLRRRSDQLGGSVTTNLLGSARWVHLAEPGVRLRVGGELHCALLCPERFDLKVAS